MIKYRGKYRVCYEMDIRTGKALEAVYIPCYLSKKSAIYRHNDNTLNLYISSIIKGRRLLEKYPGIFKAFQVGSHEMTLLFPESKLDEVATVLKVKKQGASISPRSKRNKPVVLSIF